MGGAWLLLKISINIGAHRLHCITLKEDKTGKEDKYISVLFKYACSILLFNIMRVYKNGVKR